MAYLGLGWKYSKGHEKIKKIYATEIAKGYRWATNSNVGQSLETVERFNSQGLEVFVGERTFDIDGQDSPGVVAILVRSKGHGTNAGESPVI